MRGEHEDYRDSPGRVPRLHVIRRYVGESSEENHVRIYLNLELRHFVDVPMDGIVYAEEEEGAMPFGGAYVWVREDARLVHHGSLAAPEDPTTMATGEEHDPPTTMATGEESGGLPNPLDPVVNPFGQF